MHYTQDFAPPPASCKGNCCLRETDRGFVDKTSNYWKSVLPLHQVQYIEVYYQKVALMARHYAQKEF
jgi:hypothetical protein